MGMTPLSFQQMREYLVGNVEGVVDSPVLKELTGILDTRQQDLSQPGIDWRCFGMFWPPRLIDAYRAGHLVVFFGAGLSLAAGGPSWSALLRDNLRISAEYVDDTDLQNDPLTLAEIASQRSGSHAVQAILRKVTGNLKAPTAAHLLLSCLRCPVYITTNYDDLFERAWEMVHGKGSLRVILNDSDLLNVAGGWETACHATPLLLKIHGCVTRTDEHLVLTRSDYRHHYHANSRFFDAVEEILLKRHVLFTGFSHKDPEVTRLVEDSIFKFENQARRTGVPAVADRPHFYSLQFDMGTHTPEIFAARGLVALRPPLVPAAGAAVRSLQLGVALGELVLAREHNLHQKDALDKPLQDVAQRIGAELAAGLGKLDALAKAALETLNRKVPAGVCASLQKQLGPLASQGVFLLDRDGNIVECDMPAGLNRTVRLEKRPDFKDRPYFRIANTFRESFVADSAKSVFNELSTIFLCAPVLDAHNFRGLLFAATQIGSWELPIQEAMAQWRQGRSLFIVDSTGVVLLPPNQEIQPERTRGIAGLNEDENLNVGYQYDKLLALSRRDALVSHMAENIVPLTQDDDIHELAPDLEYYSVVTEIPRTRWKLAIGLPRTKICGGRR